MFGFKAGARAKSKGYADGGEVLARAETPEQLMARMAAKYGVSNKATAPAAATPAPRPAPVQAQPSGGMIGNAVRGMRAHQEALEQAGNYADGGMVRGPGSGTSDEVPAIVPEGSYVMPADSTAKVGPEALSSMGKPVPVNLSNGEYQMPPEQVQAVGVQALDAIKAATHAPVAPKKGAAGFKPEMFFANGGEVDERNRAGSVFGGGFTGRMYSPTDIQREQGAAFVAPAASAAANQIATGEAVPNMAGWAKPGSTATPAAALSDPAPSATPAAHLPPAATASATTKPAMASPPGSAGAGETKSTVPGDGNLPSPDVTTELKPGEIVRKGNRFYGVGGNESTINGQPIGAASSPVSAQNQAAVGSLLARTPAWGSGAAAGNAPSVGAAGFSPEGPRVTMIEDSSAKNSERAALVAAATKVNPGALGLTANQLRVLGDLSQNDDKNAFAAAQNRENNAARMQEAMLRETGQNARQFLTEQGATARNDANRAIDTRRIDAEAETRGFKVREAQRLERLYGAYDKADTAGRSAIAQQIRDLSGKDTPNRFTVVPGGQAIDPATQSLVTQPSMVINNQTGEPVQMRPSQAGAATANAPAPGTTRGGYRFKGGNPADQKNWEKI